MSGFVIRRGDEVVITGSNGKSVWALAADENIKNGNRVRWRNMTSSTDPVNDHLLEVQRCAGTGNSAIRTGMDGVGVILKHDEHDVAVHPKGSDVDWATWDAGVCPDKVQRWHFVQKNYTDYPTGAPLCPGANVAIRASRKNNSQPWQLQFPGNSSDNHKDAKLGENTFADWQVWRTKGWVCDKGTCKPWTLRSQDMPTTAPYTCEYEPRTDSCNCFTTDVRRQLYSTERECQEQCGGGGGGNKPTDDDKPQPDNGGQPDPKPNDGGQPDPDDNGGQPEPQPDPEGNGQTIPWLQIGAAIVMLVLILAMLLF